MCLKKLEFLKEALECFKVANFLDKNNPDYLVSIGLTLFDLGEENKLIIVIRNLLKMNINLSS